MYGTWMKPLIALGTRWIDHRVRAMDVLVEKFGWIDHRVRAMGC